MNDYILKNMNEWERLEYQEGHPLYSLETELGERTDTLENGMTVLDAGCGSCLVTKHLKKLNPNKNINFHALDSDESILQQSRTNSKDILDDVVFFNENLTQLNSLDDESYDRYYTRLTCQHNPKNIQMIMDQAFRVLKKGGRITVIDIDGIFSNFLKNENEINEKLELLRSKIPNYDHRVSKKVSASLIEANFSEIDTKQFTMSFNNPDLLNYEYQIWKMRLSQIKNVLVNLLGENEALQFQNEFLEQVKNPLNELAYEKFIFRGVK